MAEKKPSHPQDKDLSKEAKIGLGGGVVGLGLGLGSAQLSDEGAENTPRLESEGFETSQGMRLRVESNNQEGGVMDWLNEVPEAEVLSEAEVAALGEEIVGEGLPISLSTVVHDGMNFEDAFGYAREELGTAGTFIWRGNLYGTFLKEEWETLSQEAKSTYWSGLGIPVSQGENMGEILEGIVVEGGSQGGAAQVAGEVREEMKEEAIETMGDQIGEQFGEGDELDSVPFDEEGMDDLDALADLF